jgi:hypothetical protein
VKTFIVLAFAALLGAPAVAQRVDCPPGDILAGAGVVEARNIMGEVARVTDRRVAPEGAAWSSAPAVVFAGGDASITWDLGAAREVRGLLLQGDANDRFPLSGSLDGRRFAPLTEIAALADVAGLRTRTEILANPKVVRYLRLDPPRGDGLASVAELVVFCELPQPWPPALLVEPVAAPEPAPAGSWWNDLTSRWWELLLALLGIGLLAADRRRERREGAPPRRGWRRGLFGVAAVVASLTYFNFGAFHFGNYVHTWDTLHYYLGAKYFRELSYDRLYECIAVADAADPGLEWRVQRRKITNLRTNVLGSTAEILANPELCTAHFSPDRWRRFTADVAYFRDREAPQRWEDISTDHGFNGTPVWLIAGSSLSNLAPASDRQILGLTLLDPLYFLALVAVIGWAFGVRPLAVALLVFATFFPSRFFWTGGAFLRWDWLFYTAAAVACLKKGRPWLGGMALGYAAMLRVFPGLLAAGPAAAVVAMVLRDGPRAAWRRPEVGAHLRFLGGAALAAALLVLVSLGVAGGPGAYRAFLANTEKHQATPLTNHMGLRTVVAYRPAEVGRYLAVDPSIDPWLRWKEARLAAWHQARPLAALLAAAALFLVGRAASRRPEPWIAAALGTLWIAFAVELTSYYYAFLIVPALLWSEKRGVGIALLALAAFSQWVGLGPALGMPGWRDEQYTLISLATILVFGGILVAFNRGGMPQASSTPTDQGPGHRKRAARAPEAARRSSQPEIPGVDFEAGSKQGR